MQEQISTPKQKFQTRKSNMQNFNMDKNMPYRMNERLSSDSRRVVDIAQISGYCSNKVENQKQKFAKQLHEYSEQQIEDKTSNLINSIINYKSAQYHHSQQYIIRPQNVDNKNNNINNTYRDNDSLNIRTNKKKQYPAEMQTNRNRNLANNLYMYNANDSRYSKKEFKSRDKSKDQDLVGNDVQTVYNVAKSNLNRSKVDYTSIIRIQKQKQKKLQIKKSYINPTAEQNAYRAYKIYSKQSTTNTNNNTNLLPSSTNTSLSKSKKQPHLDMIIPSLQAFNISANLNFGLFADLSLNQIQQGQIQGKKFKNRKGNQLLDKGVERSFNQQRPKSQARERPAKRRSVFEQGLNVTRRLIEKKFNPIEDQSFEQQLTENKKKAGQDQSPDRQAYQSEQNQKLQYISPDLIQKQKQKQKQKQHNQIYWKQRGKPYRQKMQILSPQKKQQARFRSKNVESIIRRKPIINLQEAMKEYCRRMNIDQNTKIFVFNSTDLWLKEILIQKGWAINHDCLSKLFHLKWTYKVSNQNEKINKQQLINHFYQSDLLTSKVQLSNTLKSHLKQLKQAICSPRTPTSEIPALKQQQKYLTKFFPKTYDLGHEIGEFIANFNQSQILCGVKKICEEIEAWIESDEKDGFEGVISWDNLGEQFRMLMESEDFTSDYQQGNEKNNLIIHIPYAVQLCAYCQNIRCMIYQQQIQQKYKLNQKAHKNLQNFSTLNPPYYQYITTSSSSTETQIPSMTPCPTPQKVHFSTKTINMYSSPTSFQKPSPALVKLLYSYHKYLCQNYNTYKSDGTRNLWIIKNRNSSKGCGIILSNNLQEILRKTQNKLVQKYIEDCCLYRPLFHDRCDNLQIRQQDGYKFDLRVWVLVTSFKPLIAYFYKQFYCRLCPCPYNPSNPSNLACHLTNYTLNKQSFQPNPNSSILSPTQLLESLVPKPPPDHLLKSLHKLIYHTLSLYQDKIQSHHQCFQLYGFDVLIDADLDAYLLEVNLSPACEERGDWLGGVVRDMGRGMLDIVLGNGKGGERWVAVRDQH